MRTLFISDLHLSDSHPEMTDFFLKFLEKEALGADGLYILGDLFETFIGDDENTLLHQKVVEALSALKKSGTPIYLMHGNRDFLIGKLFAKHSQVNLISDPTLVNLYGKPTLLMHGDTLCTDDVHYLAFRKKARNRFLQKLFLMLSIKKRRAMAEKARYLSQQHTEKMAGPILDVTPEAIQHIMKKYQVEQLIHGHTHQPGLHYFWLNKQCCSRITLSDWGKTGNFLAYYQNGVYRLEILYFS